MTPPLDVYLRRNFRFNIGGKKEQSPFTSSYPCLNCYFPITLITIYLLVQAKNHAYFFLSPHALQQSISKSYVLYLRKISLRYFFSPYITISCVDFRNSFMTDFSAFFFILPCSTLYVKCQRTPEWPLKKATQIIPLLGMCPDFPFAYGLKSKCFIMVKTSYVACCLLSSLPNLFCSQ